MIAKIDKNKVRQKRHQRVRNKLSGTAERPRLNVYRSNQHIYAQVIDDSQQVTLASASTTDPDFKGENCSNVDAAAEVCALIAKRAKDKNVETVVFDRGGYLYHGRVKALAEAARENGLQFESKEGKSCMARREEKVQEVEERVGPINGIANDGKGGRKLHTAALA